MGRNSGLTLPEGLQPRVLAAPCWKDLEQQEGNRQLRCFSSSAPDWALVAKKLDRDEV